MVRGAGDADIHGERALRHAVDARLALSVDGSYVMQNNPSARGFDNFGVGLKYPLYVNDAHECMTSVGVNAELGGTGSRAIAASYSTMSPNLYAGTCMGDLPDSLAWLRPVAVTAELGPSLTTGSGQLGIEAQIPVNRTSDSHVGILVQTHICFDDVAPHSIGKPLFQ